MISFDMNIRYIKLLNVSKETHLSDSDLNCNDLNYIDLRLQCYTGGFITKLLVLLVNIYTKYVHCSHFIPSHRHSYSIVVINQYNSELYISIQNDISRLIVEIESSSDM